MLKDKSRNNPCSNYRCPIGLKRSLLRVYKPGPAGPSYKLPSASSTELGFLPMTVNPPTIQSFPLSTLLALRFSIYSQSASFLFYLLYYQCIRFLDRFLCHHSTSFHTSFQVFLTKLSTSMLRSREETGPRSYSILHMNNLICSLSLRCSRVWKCRRS